MRIMGFWTVKEREKYGRPRGRGGNKSSFLINKSQVCVTNLSPVQKGIRNGYRRHFPTAAYDS